MGKDLVLLVNVLILHSLDSLLPIPATNHVMILLSVGALVQMNLRKWMDLYLLVSPFTS